VPVLIRVARNLIQAGVDRLVINTHTFPEQVRAVAAASLPGTELRFSHEPEAPLETGGGLLAAAGHLRGDRPILMHNVDVLTDLPLRDMYQAHAASGALVTLAVQQRASARGLLFDELGLVGREDDAHGISMLARDPVGEVVRWAFCGVHIAAPELPARITPRPGAFSIVEPYLELAAAGARLLPYRADGRRWIDIGSPASLARAEREFGSA
jgi:N-acetyl-alpha-D-muramate 1-phosphate uridylyltransferase